MRHNSHFSQIAVALGMVLLLAVLLVPRRRVSPQAAGCRRSANMAPRATMPTCEAVRPGLAMSTIAAFAVNGSTIWEQCYQPAKTAAHR